MWKGVPKHGRKLSSALLAAPSSGLKLMPQFLSGQLRNHSFCVKTMFLTPWIFLTGLSIECFHMTSRRPYLCPKTMKRRPCWCFKPILWELNSFLTQTLSFVPINLHRCWSRGWKHSIGMPKIFFLRSKGHNICFSMNFLIINENKGKHH